MAPVAASIDPRRSLNAICPYFTMFPLEFPRRVLRSHPSAKLVLDPFCGRGTTLYAARLAGKRAIGIDCSPVAVAIAQAKLANVSMKEVLALADELIANRRGVRVPKGPFWTRAFHPQTLRDVCALRKGLRHEAPSDRVSILRAAALGCLHGPLTMVGSYFSNQMPRTFSPKPDYSVSFWKARNMPPHRVDVRGALKRKLERLEQDTTTPRRGRLPLVLAGDASDEQTFNEVPSRVDLVITSPPYYGMRTYVADQWLRYWFLGGPPHVEYEEPLRLPTTTPEDFAAALGRTWQHASSRSPRRLHLYIRFGGIPSRAANPKELLRSSLEVSGVNWRIVSCRAAHSAESGKRQALQMRDHTSAIDEFDLHVVRC